MYSLFKILLTLIVYLPVKAGGRAERASASFVKADNVMPVKLKADATAFKPAGTVAVLSVTDILRGNIAAKGVLGFSQSGRMIDAWYFPGTSNKKALVIGGVHGSELSSIEVANDLIKKLQQEKPYYSVIVVPCLFPDNAEAARADRAGIGGVQNTGRYSHQAAADPNRQMPSLGKAFDPASPVDHLGRTIELENQLLLGLIAQFRPDRIANIHAIRDAAHAGIYADPRTDSRGVALGFSSDSSLAVDMAMHVAEKGGYVPGNQVNKRAIALYYKDPAPAATGELQKRNTCGSQLASNRGHGISLGSWASTGLEDADTANNRPAIRLITIEFPGYKAPTHYSDEKQKQYFARQVSLYASSIFHVFLGDYYAEN